MLAAPEPTARWKGAAVMTRVSRRSRGLGTCEPRRPIAGYRLACRHVMSRCGSCTHKPNTSLPRKQENFYQSCRENQENVRHGRCRVRPPPLAVSTALCTANPHPTRTPLAPLTGGHHEPDEPPTSRKILNITLTISRMPSVITSQLLRPAAGAVWLTGMSPSALAAASA